MPYKKTAKPVNSVEDKTVPVEKTVKWKSKICRVVNYIPSHGILGFDFDGISCQISVQKNLNIGNTVKIQYTGEMGKGIKFKM